MTKLQYQALKPRDKAKYCVAKLAPRLGKSEPQVWGLAYKQLGRKLGYNLKDRAKAEDRSILDLLDGSDQIGALLRTLQQLSRGNRSDRDLQ